MILFYIDNVAIKRDHTTQDYPVQGQAPLCAFTSVYFSPERGFVGMGAGDQDGIHGAVATSSSSLGEKLCSFQTNDNVFRPHPFRKKMTYENHC